MPLWDTQAVLKNWSIFTEGLEKIALHTDDEMDFNTLLNEILSGKLLMWIGFVDGEYNGFSTTKFSENSLGKRYLWVVHGYIKIEGDHDAWTEGMKVLEEFARKSNCSALKFYTDREKPYARKISKLGWRITYTEFVKDIK